MAIEREKILDTALVVLNEVGLDALTTRKLALYWHFRSKGDLLDALNGEILERFHTHHVPAPGERWDAFLLANARSFRRALLAVRNGARINAGTRPNASQFADAEKQLRLYVDAGFSADEAFNISVAVARYVVGFVLEEQDERADEEAPGMDPMDQVAPFPLLAGALRPLITTGTINTEAVFEAGLAYMVNGMRASLVGREAQAPIRRGRRPERAVPPTRSPPPGRPGSR